MTTKNEKIVEDVIYYRKGKDGKIESSAKSCFYYTFLMSRASSPFQGAKNRKAAEDFEAFQKIFAYLLESGYLTNPDYCIDFDEIDGGACFSLNLGKLLEDVDLETELLERFEGQLISEHIYTFCHPVEILRCHYCGAFSFSRGVQSEEKGKPVFCCLACHPLRDSIRKEIKAAYSKGGSQAAVLQRLSLIEKYSQVQIPEGKSINQLIEEYLQLHVTDVEDVRVTEIRAILEHLGFENYDVFTTNDFDILMLNREALSDIKVFSECVATDYETGEILIFFGKEGAVYINEDVVKFAKTLK